MLSKNAIVDFKKRWVEEFNEELSDQEAQEKAENFLGFFKMIYQPIPKKIAKNNKK